MATNVWNDTETRAIMRPDEPRVFSTYVRDFTLVCGERVLRAAPAGRRGGAVRFFAPWPRPVKKNEFDAAWADGPPDAWLAAPAKQHALRVLHNSIVQTPPDGYDYDGISEWWFASADAARAALATGDLRARLPAAYVSVADLTHSVFMSTRVSHRRP